MVMPLDSILRNNKEKQFELDFFPHANALYNFAFHLTYNDADADDLVQETFLKAFKYIDHYQAGTNAKAWLFKILKNGFINQYRKKSKAPNIVDYEDIIAFQDFDDESDQKKDNDLRVEIFDNLIGDEVSLALNTLPVDFKTVILLCDIEGFTYEEIAKIIDIPVGTVRSRLHRARNLLKEKLEKYALSMGFKK
jgi:RNA polymerase sigma factor (sigma-70 family)